MMILDLFGAVFSGWMALCMFGLHIISAPERGNWMTLPSYVRIGFLVSGAAFLWRSVNLFALGMADEFIPPGHLNLQGFISLSALCYMITALVYWQFRRIMADPRGWQRILWVEKELHEHPDKVPVVVEKEEVIDQFRRQGVPATKSCETYDPECGPSDAPLSTNIGLPTEPFLDNPLEKNDKP